MFSDPVQNLKQIGLMEHMIVADLGAGTGFYSIAAAHLVPRGKVYAVEVQKDFLPTIREKAKSAHVNNIECLWGNVEKIGGTKIADGIVDVVIASNILFQVLDKEKFIDEIKRILKPEGRVLFVDWSDASSAMGPNAKMLVPKEKGKEMFSRKGFIYKRDINAGEHHYGMMFERP